MASSEMSAVDALLGAAAYTGGIKPKRWQIGPDAVALLEAVYAETACPSRAVKESLAQKLGATQRQIQVWFQNKRQRALAKAAKYGGLPTIGDTPACETECPSPARSSSSSAEYYYSRPPAMPQHATSHRAGQHSLSAGSGLAHSSYVAAPVQSSSPPRSAAASAHMPPPAMRRNDTVNSLADLAEVAGCMDSIERLGDGGAVGSPGLPRVSSLKELQCLARQAEGATHSPTRVLGPPACAGVGEMPRVASLQEDLTQLASKMEGELPPSRGSMSERMSRIGSLADLGQISRIGSLADFSGVASSGVTSGGAA